MTQTHGSRRRVGRLVTLALVAVAMIWHGTPVAAQQPLPEGQPAPPADGSKPATPLGPLIPPDAIPLGTPAGVFFEPSAVLTQAHDDNVFLDAEARTADFFTRVTPGLVAGVRTSRLLLVGAAQFDAERYHQQESLDTLQARRFLSVEVTGLVTPRVAILASATHAFTTTPSELNLLSGLVRGRADTYRMSARASVVGQTSPRGRVSAGYALTHDEITGFDSALTHEATAEYRHAVSERTFYSSEYTLRLFDFGDALGQQPAHVFAIGFGRTLTPTTTLTVRGGPRLSRTSLQPALPVPVAPAEVGTTLDIDPEWRVAFARRGRRGDVELSVAQSQTTAIGQNVVIDTLSAGASLRYQPSERVELRLSPSVYRDTGGPLEARVFRVTAELLVWLGNHVALVSQFSGSYQDALNAPVATPGLGTLRQNIVSVGLRASARRRVPAREPGTAASSVGVSR